MRNASCSNDRRCICFRFVPLSCLVLFASLLGVLLGYLACGLVAHVLDRQNLPTISEPQLAGMSFWEFYLLPAAGCSITGGLTVVLYYALGGASSFARSFIHAGLSMILGILVSGVISGVLSLGPRTYTSDPFALVRLAIAVLVAATYCLLMVRRGSKRAGPYTG
jgi:hypothetical protein